MNMAERSLREDHEYELLIQNEHSEGDDTTQPQKPTKPVFSFLSKWQTFAAGFWIGLIVTAIIFLLALWLTAFTNNNHKTPGKLEVLSKGIVTLDGFNKTDLRRHCRYSWLDTKKPQPQRVIQTGCQW